MRLPVLGLLSAVLWASACAGPREAAPEAPAGPPAYETFDPAGAEAPPARPAAVQHDVPPRLMEGRVEVPAQNEEAPSAPRPQTVQGFRIQVFSGEDRAAAERVRGEAEAWARGEGGHEATVAYIQPYYRVRVGAFATRGEAEAALAGVRARFPEAFLVPDLVTIYE